MEELDELPLKMVELPLSKFNEVAIPHHLELLRQHKANIIKLSESGQWRQVAGERAGAARAAGRLRALLADLAALRNRVRPADRPAFDRTTQAAREDTLKAIQDYLTSSPVEIRGNSPNSEELVAGSAVSTDSVGIVAHCRPDDTEDDEAGVDLMSGLTVQLEVDDHEERLRESEAVCEDLGALERDVRDLHHTWRTLHHAAQTQGEQVVAVETTTEAAAENVAEARRQLTKAEKIRMGVLGVSGCVAGALVGGPVGLVAGAKAGLAAALAGSLLALYSGNKLPHS